MGKILVLSFSDEEEDIYQRMMQIISDSKNFEWCNMLQETKNIQIGELIVDLSKRSVITGNTEVTLTNREFVERFPELSLFYRLFSPLDSEMICIFPYFCPYVESAREIRGFFI